jgi:exopolysaccharide production protein ExoQ
MDTRPSRPGAAEWVFMVAMLVVAMSDPFNGPASHSKVEPPASNPVSVMTWLLFYALAAWFARPVRARVLQAARLDWPIIGLVVLATASTLWSVDPQQTARRGVALAGGCGVAWYAAARFEPDELRRQLLWACMIGMLLSIVLVFIPDVGITPPDDALANMADGSAGTWRGMYLTKNVFGQVAALTMLMLLLETARLRGWRRGLMMLATVATAGLVLASRSSTAVGVALVMLGVCAVLPLLRAHALAGLSWAAALLGVGAIALAGLLANSSALLKVLDRDVTLTGRTLLWGVVLDQIAERPWLGWGHQAFWNNWAGVGSSRVWEIVGWTPGYAHNGFLDQAIGLGIVGVALLCWCLLGTARAVAWWARHSPRTAMALWPAAVLVFLVLANLTEGGLVQQNSYMWILLVLVSATARLQRAGADPGRAHAMAPLQARPRAVGEPG